MLRYDGVRLGSLSACCKPITSPAAIGCIPPDDVDEGFEGIRWNVQLDQIDLGRCLYVSLNGRIESIQSRMNKNDLAPSIHWRRLCYRRGDCEWAWRIVDPASKETARWVYLSLFVGVMVVYLI